MLRPSLFIILTRIILSTVVGVSFVFSASAPKAPSSISKKQLVSSLGCAIEVPKTKQIRYQKPVVILPELCSGYSETQLRECQSTGYTEWTGSYNYPSCVEISGDSQSGPLISGDSIKYAGGFRINSDRQGVNQYATSDYSTGAFTMSEDGRSIFLVGNNHEARIGQVEIPEIVNTRIVTEMNVADNFLQEFQILNDPGGRHDPGIDSFFRVTGILELDGKLIVNYFSWYDANGQETDTTSVFSDSSDLENSPIVGPFQLDGAARSAGWISPVPPSWQARLNGTHVSGWAQGSINSRLSNGPSAYFWNPFDDLLTEPTGKAVEATVGLNYPLDEILYDESLYGSLYDGTYTANKHILLNDDKNNNLWTYLSGASYGFIVPDSNTYVTVGFSGGHIGGIGYKWKKPDGSYCSGHCAKDPLDIYNYYWLWKLTDIEAAVNGSISPSSIRPYEFGKLDTINNTASVSGGSYNPETGQLILSLTKGDTFDGYRRAPLFLVYYVKK